ncbi:MAG: siphovirus ReqiPepy6 Gp37-like family protein [Muribaculaceae bacterium]|nr:siphovirus ReqiPepy6 Gp37-like family protein [Muribaculaceae bacterium]
MQLLALDAAFEPVAYLEYLNLQWIRQYYSPGQHSVQIPAANYQPEMQYLYTPDRPETGIIQKAALSETIKGRFVQLSGHFLEAILNDKIVWPTYYAKGNSTPETVVAMLRQYKGDIPRLNIAEAPAMSGTEPAIWQETGGALGSVAYAKLQGVQQSLRCRYDHLSGTITAEVWQGTDRTQGQTQNPFVTFSDGFGNLTKVDASQDNSNYRNYAVVAGQDQGDVRKIAYADLSGGGYHRELYVDARNQQWDPEKQTEAEYLAALQRTGLEKLAKYQIVRNVEIDVTNSGFVYLQDWNLGDKVDVIVPDIGLAMEARIVTVREVFKAGNHSVEIELGDKKLSQLAKARMMV